MPAKASVKYSSTHARPLWARPPGVNVSAAPSRPIPPIIAETVFIPTTSYVCTSIDVAFQRRSTKAQCHSGHLYLAEGLANGKPGIVLTGPHTFVIPDLALYAVVVINVPIPPTLLTASSLYSVIYGTYDRTINRWYYGTPQITFLRTKNPTCGTVANKVYRREFDRVKNQPCGRLTRNWTLQSPYDYWLYFKTYGTDP